ncbi:MAG: 4Fe-4S binding protein [Spirochaetes bacterium]|nr:4Fe-4S binding protein [Spirochaetota bacterium]
MENAYRELCARMGLPESENLLGVWKTLCTPEEAALAVLLPGTAAGLSEKTGKGVEAVQALLDSLFLKGAVFKAPGEGPVSYRLAKNIVQFHDASLVWSGATGDFFGLWKRVMDGDFSALMRDLPPDMVLPSFMRVIPVNETITMQSGVLPYEACVEMIDRSERIAVVQCPCRLSQRNCGASLESCIQLNRGADYALERGHGRTITREEALAILKRSEEEGLVHMVENRGFGNAICNCCECCCEMFRLAKYSGKKWILSPSRYRASVDRALCTACGACEDRCPVEAISVGEGASIDAELCLGCGLCISSCPVDAIVLDQVRPLEHIPVK